MNAIVKTEGTLPAPAELITVAPETYVAAVFAPFDTQLEHAIVASKGLDYDITTTAGLAVAKEQRAIFRDLRVNAEKVRKERKEPVLRIGKLLDGHYKALEKSITPHEDRWDAEIKAEEDRKEREKAEKLAREQEKERRIADEMARMDGLHKKVNAIRSLSALAAGQSASLIGGILTRAQAIQIDDSYAEFADMARGALAEAITSLQAMFDAATQAEADRAELEKLRGPRPAPKPAAPVKSNEAVVKVAAEAIAKAKAPPPFDPEPAVPLEQALFDALLTCHGFLTGRTTNMSDAIAKAELALIAAGATPEQLGLIR